MIAIEKKDILLAVLIVLIATTIYLYGRNDVPSQRDRITEVRDNISTTGQQQQSAAAHISTAENGLAEARQSVSVIAERNETIQARFNDSTSLISEGTNIVRGIYQRGQVRDKQP